MMKLQMYTKDCRHDEPDSSNIYFAANWLGCFAPLLLSSVLVLTSKQVNIFLWVLLFYRNKSNSSLYWNAAIGKRQKSPINTSSNNQQVSQWKCNPPKHQMLSQAPQHPWMTLTKSRTRGLFPVYPSDNKRPQQATTNKHASTKILLPRTNTRHYERRNSNKIYEIKNKTVFTTHNRPQQTTTGKYNGTGKSHCQERKQGIMIITSTISLRNTLLA